MNKYLLLSQAAGIGGWQLYTEARLTYLLEKKIDVYTITISGEHSKEIKLKTFKENPLLCVPEIHLPPVAFTQKQQKSIISKILNFMSYTDKDQVFIEATDMYLSMWGELIAEKTSGVCFSYLLHSHIENVSQDVQEFFDFKYQHNLLAGMADSTLNELFEGYREVPNDDRRCLVAATKSPLTDENNKQEITDEMRAIKEAGGYVITYFGNLEKPHFTMLCDVMADYFKLYTNEKFLFVSIGSSEKEKAEKYQQRVLDSCDNCQSINVPAMYPVPRQMFAESDVCIASWGCSENAATAGAVTIRLENDISLDVLGIEGITIVNQTEYASSTLRKSIQIFLNEVLFENMYAASDIKPIERVEVDFRTRNVSHDNLMKPFMCDATQYSYYNIANIKHVNTRVSIEKLLNYVFGFKFTKCVIRIAKKIKE